MNQINSIIINSDNIAALKNYEDNYFDAVVTDPPYGLGKEPNAEEVMKGWIENGYHEVSGNGFMGKEWDAFIPQPIFWKEVFRVLKHGGHVVSFFGTRTYDWGVMSMRFAGFEIRDCIQWIYGSGFPKSHNISKAIDKIYGAEREVIGSKITGTMNNNGGASVNKEGWDGGQKEVSITAPSTDSAKKWEGWGSALKPANEPIVLARKPLEKGLSIAENVLKWGTGGINIDGCRVELSEGDDSRLGGNGSWKTDKAAKNVYEGGYEGKNISSSPLGRFPANVILDEDAAKVLDEQSGINESKRAKRGDDIGNGFHGSNSEYDTERGHSDSGGASRFFYCAKASKSERDKGLEGFEEKQASSMSGRSDAHDMSEYKIDNDVTGRFVTTKQNFHPTVKPVKLMQYLVRLITPPNGKILDPFCGSGTTGIACKLEGFSFVGIEQDAEYSQIAIARIENYQEEKEDVVEMINQEGVKITLKQGSLF